VVDLSSFVRSYSAIFCSSDKSELGIFWMDDALSDVIHSKTVVEEDIDKNDPTQYSFQHYNEWANRPSGIEGGYKDYPRGRIFYQDQKYIVECDFQVSAQVETFLRKYFTLPIDTEFKFGAW